MGYKKRIYKKKITVVDGMEFDSMYEAKCYKILRDLYSDDEDLSFDVKPLQIIVSEKFSDNIGNNVRARKYSADYAIHFLDKDVTLLIETKGYADPSFTLRESILQNYLKGQDDILYIRINQKTLKEDMEKLKHLVEYIKVNNRDSFASWKKEYSKHLRRKKK